MDKLKLHLSILRSSFWHLRLLVKQSSHLQLRILRAAFSGFLWWSALTTSVMAQADPSAPHNLPIPKEEELSLAPEKVAVEPIAHDEEIRKRLQSVLEATGWIVAPQVEVVDGVVFLKGRSESDEIKKWAGDLTRNTQDVVAVANRIEVSQPSAWDFRGARSGLSGLSRDLIRSLPFLLVALFILALSAGAGWLTARGTRKFLIGRVRAKLLRGVLAGGLGVIVFLAGTYVVLRVSGLTQLALTIVGGTGLVGLAVGIAFRDITENFLASIFLSIQRPFETGDMVEIVGVTGYVRQLNIRTTVLLTLDGNLVQVPNAAVYKSTLQNFTATPNRREDFVVGIGYDDAIDEAQDVALKVLLDHPAVLKEPEPWVLADDLGKATVNLRIYFWINGHEHSWLKVRSSVIRLVKRAFQKHGISMPDEAREVVFPHGVPVTMLDTKQEPTKDPASLKSSGESLRSEGLDTVSTKAEAGLSNEAGIIEEQARQAQSVDEGENLLGATTSVHPRKVSRPGNKRILNHD
ncbi:MAG: mechanosensitive ion channel family protein [Verrucomicrobiota bacterium]|nr:mechanosensitive ion channel family protein [Verrucomicrobiota bacterium]